MGFGSTLGMFLIAFVFFMTFGAILFAMQSNFISEATALGNKQSQMIDLQHSSINITEFYNQTPFFMAKIQHIGSLPLDTSQLDFYINGQIVPRLDSSRIIWYETSLHNPTLFDPGETIGINFSIVASPNSTLVVTTQTGATDSVTYPYMDAQIMTETRELLVVHGYNYSGGTYQSAFVANDIAAINTTDALSRLLYRSADGTSRFNMTLSNITNPAETILNATVYFTYVTGSGNFNSFEIMARDGPTGNILCRKIIQSTTTKTTEQLDCTSLVTPGNVNDVWLHLNNTATNANREFTVDFISMNVTYTYTEP